ncbi:20ab588f-3e53-46e0-ac4b-32766457a631 [Sclerotinia trifoliorum]|uniref:20ab588f-3e53-46e0-ac4b-32766457a631 n=1 Tax=Sclerotinia trifoliorum TaxID=28548 RepID=A0A8H2VVW1_9HELO|nr:20ab588f-3e53-46e0-ac4b-32766457a631 [Sclerotinia trifoliorum]
MYLCTYTLESSCTSISTNLDGLQMQDALTSCTAFTHALACRLHMHRRSLLPRSLFSPVSQPRICTILARIGPENGELEYDVNKVGRHFHGIIEWANFSVQSGAFHRPWSDGSLLGAPGQIAWRVVLASFSPGSLSEVWHDPQNASNRCSGWAQPYRNLLSTPHVILMVTNYIEFINDLEPIIT